MTISEINSVQHCKSVTIEEIKQGVDQCEGTKSLKLILYNIVKM